MTLKDQLQQEIRHRHLYLTRTSRDHVDDLSEFHNRLDSSGSRDFEAVLLDQQARKIVDDLVEPQLIGRALSPVVFEFTRSRSPFRGHWSLPHSPVSDESSLLN